MDHVSANESVCSLIKWNGLNDRVCNPKQKWNPDECQCECKELDDRGFCEEKKNYKWSPSSCECECNKACKID